MLLAHNILDCHECIQTIIIGFIILIIVALVFMFIGK